MKNKNSASKWLLAGIVFAVTFLVTVIALWPAFFPEKFNPFKGVLTDITGELIAPDSSTIKTEKKVEKQNCEEAKITLKATGKDNLQPRKPIDVVFVLDRSGSMAGTKIDSLKKAAKNFVNQMNFSSTNGSPDRVAIIDYNDKSDVEYALGSDKTAATNAIDGLSASGNTCIGCGLEVGRDQIKNELDNLRLQVVILLSDGLANRTSSTCGSADPKQCAKNIANEIKNNLNLPLYSIGYGSDADPTTLKAISSGDDYYFAGDTNDIVSIYNKIIKNITEVAGYDVQVVEVLPTGIDYIPGTFSPRDPDVISSDKKTLTWEIGNLLVGDSKEFSFNVSIDYKKVNVSSEVLMDKVPDTRVQFHNYDNTSYYTPFPEVKAKIDECPRPAITLKKTADKDEIIAGESVKYSFEVNNTGNTTLSNVSINDNKLGAIACPKNQLAAKEKMTCTKETVLEQRTTNTAVVKAVDSNEKEVSAEDTATVLVGTRDENLTISKTVDRNKVAAGEKVIYSYEVKNGGNVAVKNLVVDDDKLGNIVCPKTELAPGESMKCSAKEATVEDDIVNIATVTGKSAITGETLVNTDKAEVKVNSEGVSINKSVSSSKVDKGDKVTYTFSVSNTGQSKLTDIVVSDDKLGTITCPKTVLEVGEKMTCSKEATIDKDTTNIATVTGKNPGGKTVTDKSSSVTVSVSEEKEEKPGKGEIGNLIWLDANCNGIHEKNEPGLNNIRVKATWFGPNDKRGDRDDVDYRTDTNHNGHYNFEKLKDGEYRVTVKEEDLVGYTQSYDPDGKLDNKTDIKIKKGDGTTKADFGYCKAKAAPATGVSWMVIALIAAVCTGLMTVFLMIKKRRI